MGRSKRRPVDWLVERGSEIAGNSAAVSAGLMLGGSQGALVGAVVAPVVAQISEFGMRALGRREEERVSAVVVFACRTLADLQSQGAAIRTDGFFDAASGHRSDGEEIVEAVMRAAQLSHEERKLPHLGALLALLAVDETYDRGLGNWLIRSAEQLSWTQYVLLALIPPPDSEKEPLPAGEVMVGPQNWNAWSVHRELVELGYGKLELVSWAEGTTPLQQFRYPLAEMSGMRLRHGGGLLHNALVLDDVPDDELRRVRDLLSVNVEADDATK